MKAIYKNGAKDTAENYRPISLTCVPCKIMETIITDKVVDHMIKNKLFTNAQFGFRSLRSRALQLLDVMECL